MINIPIILASQSVARRRMMENSGLRFSIMPAKIEEEKIIGNLQNKKINPPGIALELSMLKAFTVAQDNPESLIIGSDQILVFKKEIMTKSKTRDEARKKLMKLRGKTHTLISAVTVVKENEVLWQHLDEAKLKMFKFHDELLDAYCERAGEALIRSVGGYELESQGSWLFSSVEGDFFTILGMPLLPLLNYLHEKQGLTP